MSLSARAIPRRPAAAIVVGLGAMALVLLGPAGGNVPVAAQTSSTTVPAGGTTTPAPPGSAATPDPSSTPDRSRAPTTPGTTTRPAEREVRVAITPLDPFVVKRAVGYGGFSIELWEEIAKRNNYRSVYVEKRSVEAQLEAVRNGEADIALGAVTVNPTRATTVEFTEPTLSSGLQIMVATGQSSAIAGLWRAVFDPAVLLLMGLMAAAVALAAVVIWFLERTRNPDFAHKAGKGIGEGTWWASVTIATIGYGDRVPRTFLGRAFSIMWMIFGMLLVAAVTATFTANLTVHRLKTNIANPDDLRDHSVVTVRDSAAAAYLREHRIPFQSVATTDAMIDAVRNGETSAAVYDGPVLARAVHQSDGNLALSGPQFTHGYDAIAVRPGDELRSPINYTLLTLYDDGTYDHIYRAWFVI